MTGDKPDEQLRTPMQWTGAPGAGFTRGTPWEPLQADWATTNVAAQENDPTSLLASFRTLIHLRAESSALGSGDWLPLATSSDAVAAYLRRNGTTVALVVANLGSVTLSDVMLTAPPAALPAGRYTVRSLFGGATLAPLSVEADGSVRGYMPLGSLMPMSAQIVALAQTN